MDDVSQLLSAANAGDRASADRVFALVYADLKRLARRQVAGAEASHGATSLVHEAWLRMAQASEMQINDRAHFFALAAQVMRQLVIDRARRVATAKRGGGRAEEDLDEFAERVGSPDEAQRLLELDQALTRLAALDPKLVQLVEMRFFAGLELEEIEPLTGRSQRSLRRDWQRARAMLHAMLDSGDDPHE